MVFHITENNHKTLQKEIATFCKDHSLSTKAHMTLVSGIFEAYVEKGKETIQLKDVIQCIKNRYDKAGNENAKEHYEYMVFKLEHAILPAQTK